MEVVAITGASGYVGSRLAQLLARQPQLEVRALIRRGSPPPTEADGRLTLVRGDIIDPSALAQLLRPGCTVVNFAYDAGVSAQTNIAGAGTLAQACRATPVRRLIHCSTAAVAGRAPDDRITEATRPRPISEYGITKLRIEEIIVGAARDHFDTAIIRPTAVFGPGGEPLKNLADNLVTGSRLRNYVKSCLFHKRRMNLVHVANVVAAIVFLIQHNENLDGETFIISDDDSPANNFADVERFLMRAFDIPDYHLPRLPLPSALLAFLLRCLGRNNVNPHSNYDGTKLRALGFVPPVNFEAGLAEYAMWYRSACLHRQRNAAR